MNSTWQYPAINWALNKLAPVVEKASKGKMTVRRPFPNQWKR